MKMESNDIIIQLQNIINQLKQINITSLNISEGNKLEIKEKELLLIKKIVGCFDEILSDKLNIKNENIKEPKQNKNYYWTFISHHFNNPLVHFCVINDKSELSSLNEDENLIQKGENWIFLSILEETFSDSINEIYKYGLDEIYYEKDSILRKYKSEIMDILKELKQIQFINIKNKDYEKYLEYLTNNKVLNDKNKSNFNSKTQESPIFDSTTSHNHCIFSEISMIPFLKNFGIDNSDTDYKIHIERDIKNGIQNSQEEKDFIYEKSGDFAPKIINEFYTFIPNLDEKNEIINEEKKQKEDKNPINIHNNNNISCENINSSFDKNSNSELNSSEEEPKSNHKLILNPKISRFLPTDNLYEIN